MPEALPTWIKGILSPKSSGASKPQTWPTAGRLLTVGCGLVDTAHCSSLWHWLWSLCVLSKATDLVPKTPTSSPFSPQGNVNSCHRDFLCCACVEIPPVFGVPTQEKCIIKPFRIWPMPRGNILTFKFERLSSFYFLIFKCGTSWTEKNSYPADIALVFLSWTE